MYFDVLFSTVALTKKGVLITHDVNKSVAIFLVLLLINRICENKKDHNHKNKTCLFCLMYLYNLLCISSLLPWICVSICDRQTEI